MSITDLNGKQKIRLLCAGLVLSLFFIYQFSIRNTINVYQQYKHNYIPEELLQEKQDAYSQLRQKDHLLNQLLKKVAPVNDSLNDEQVVLKHVTMLCEQYKLKLDYFSPFNIFEYENINVNTKIVAVEGGFHRILRFINDMENNHLPARISAVEYKSYEDRQTETTKLTAKIYLQQLQLFK